MKGKNDTRRAFNCVSYALTFDFCTMREKAAVLRALCSAWTWGVRRMSDNKAKKK